MFPNKLSVIPVVSKCALLFCLFFLLLFFLYLRVTFPCTGLSIIVFFFLFFFYPPNCLTVRLNTRTR